MQYFYEKDQDDDKKKFHSKQVQLEMERIRSDRTGHQVTYTTKYFGAYQLRRALYHDAFKIIFACDRKEEEYEGAIEDAKKI